MLGVAIVAAACATFFTPFGAIITTVYAMSMIGGGVAMFVIACIGLCAACEDQKKQNVLPLCS